MIKLYQMRALTGQQINKMSEAELNAYTVKANKIIARNMKQYEKPNKALGGHAAVEYYGTMYQDMKQLQEQFDSANTAAEKRLLLAQQRAIMRRENWTPTMAQEHMEKLSKGAYGQFFEGFEELQQSERATIIENTKAIFANFNADEIERIGSGEIVRISAKYINKGLDYKEFEKRATRAVKYYMNKYAGGNQRPEKTMSFFEYQQSKKGS